MTSVTTRTGATVVRGAIALIFSTVASSVLGVLFWLVGARVYTPEQLGRAAAAVSAITLLSGLAQMSLSTVLVRFLPTAGSATGRMLGYSQAAVASVSVILAAGFWLLGFGADYLPAGQWPFLLFCATVAAFTMTAVHDGAFTGLGRTRWVPVRTVGSATARLVLLVVLAGGGLATPVLLGWSLPTIAVAVLTCAALLLPRLRAPRFPAREELPTRGELVHFVGAQYLSGIVSSIGNYAPPLIVTAVLGPAVNGTSFYIPWLVWTVAAAMSWNVVVAFVVAVAKEPAAPRAHLWHTFRLLFAINVVGGALLVVGAPYLLAALGPQYAEGGTGPLRMLGLALPFAVPGLLYSAAAIIRKRPWATLWLGLAGTSMFLGSASWAVGRYGVMGVGVAALVCQVVLALAILPATVRQLRALLAEGEQAARRDAAAPVPTVRGVARVPRIGPGAEAGPVAVVFFPAEVGEWLASAETVHFTRIGRESSVGETTTRLPRFRDGGTSRHRESTDSTVPQPRASSEHDHRGP